MPPTSSPKDKILKLFKYGAQYVGVVSTLLVIIVYVLIRGNALGFINEFDKELALIEKTTFVFDVQMEQEVPYSLSMPLSEIVDINQLIPDSVHVNETIPVTASVPISQNITTTVNIPYAGSQQVTFPISATIPINTQVTIDQDVNIEDAEVTDQQIEINDTVPVTLNFQVKKSIADLGLTQHITQTHGALNSLRLFFLSGTKELSDFSVPDEEVKAIEVVIE